MHAGLCGKGDGCCEGEDSRLDADLIAVKRGGSGPTLHGGGERETGREGCGWTAPGGSAWEAGREGAPRSACVTEV